MVEKIIFITAIINYVNRYLIDYLLINRYLLYYIPQFTVGFYYERVVATLKIHNVEL